MSVNYTAKPTARSRLSGSSYRVPSRPPIRPPVSTISPRLETTEEEAIGQKTVAARTRLHNVSKTGDDSRRLQTTQEGNELYTRQRVIKQLTTKVVHHQYVSFFARNWVRIPLGTPFDSRSPSARSWQAILPGAASARGPRVQVPSLPREDAPVRLRRGSLHEDTEIPR